jgi:integrase/recombinase XerD
MEKKLDYPIYNSYLGSKLTYKVKLYKFVRTDNTSALHLQIFLNKKRIRFPLDLSVPAQFFDVKKQRIKQNYPYSKDYNLIIEKKLADINKIEVSYRLSNKKLDLESLISELTNPTARMDFIKFWTDEMERQKDLISADTFRQQMTMLNKTKNFKNPLFFHEIDDDLIQDLKTHCKIKLKNNPNTISSLIKSFKKYLHIANKRGIVTPITFDDIKNKSFKGNRTFLDQKELVTLDGYWSSNYINETHKKVLSRFLFSCFTGIRISDSKKLKEENFIENVLVFTAKKTGKFQRIPLNETAKKYIDRNNIDTHTYTNEYTNLLLKEIASLLKIRKKITFHVSRHTFATNFLICGGRVEHLQKILGHSKIEDTMIYVHIIEQITNVQINNMDEILRT